MEDWKSADGDDQSDYNDKPSSVQKSQYPFQVTTVKPNPSTILPIMI